jgi:hypothetical protein
MGTDEPVPADEVQRSALRSAVRTAELTLEQLWTRYFALGGDVDLVEIDAFLSGLLQLPGLQRDLLAHAVNERLEELYGRQRVPYSSVVHQRRPASGPLAALVHLLDAAHEAPPERLGRLALDAGRALDAGVTVHLVDHEQRRLVLVPVGDARATSWQGVDGTLAGRAYQTGHILPAEGGTVPRLWVPLIDGADRLGVVEVRPAAAGDLYDPTFREQCWWVARLLGHVIAGLDPYGDELHRVRRSRPRTPAAELLWQQLPPLTAATDAFVLSGLLEPSYEAGGDAFDYALSAGSVSLAIFDAMGHGMSAALMAATALAGYRSARRDGRGLFDQSTVLDEVVATCFPGSAFVTGVLAELDVVSGRLRYLVAGHPAPLLLRGGKVVKRLTAGRRVPFGIECARLAIAEEVLQPGDWLVLYTDGIVEARDAAGRWFGEDRLTDLLAREVSAGLPPPETARRLVRAVLTHQGGLLQDDASILLARWNDRADGAAPDEATMEA